MHPSLPFLYVLSEWAIRFVMLVYVPQRRTPAAARTWLLLIFLLPWPGFLLYAVIGRIKFPAWRFARQREVSGMIREWQRTRPVHPGPGQPDGSVPALVHALGDFRALGGNTIELLPDYAGSIARLAQEIDGARESVHLLYYIFADDDHGGQVVEAVLRAKARGVECRVLVDSVGSRKFGLPALLQRFRAAGIPCHEALPAGLFRRGAARFDLRNHRKVAVIDNRVGFTGSQNLVNPGFVPGYPNEELVSRVTGPVVLQLLAVFLQDWFFETGELPLDPEQVELPAEVGTSVAQVLPSGPGYARENAQELLVHLFHRARRRIVITTPYFVPDAPFLQALRTAVRRGVEVHLVVAYPVDKWVMALAQRSYFDELLSAGVRIHMYRPHFLHAKHVSIDDDLAIVGSVNMDIRSFALNAEVALLAYDPKVVEALRAVQERYFAAATELTAEAWARRPLWVRVAQNTARLGDSLL
ncbi:MAG TPA: cardiolipin synthase [Gemmatimonadales bacterium]|nr:cardiolipin synthase [Gemmatimonadales bacterium]